MKFLVTKELGKLCKWLRILGFDVEYFKSANISSIIVNALREERVLLTRKTDLGKHPGIRTIIVKSDDFKKQLQQVINTFSLPVKKERVFSRCLVCNEKLDLRPKEKVKHKVPPYIYNKHQKFMQCNKCGRIYWQGTHWQSVNKIIKKL